MTALIVPVIVGVYIAIHAVGSHQLKRFVDIAFFGALAIYVAPIAFSWGTGLLLYWWYAPDETPAATSTYTWQPVQQQGADPYSTKQLPGETWSAYLQRQSELCGYYTSLNAPATASEYCAPTDVNTINGNW